MPDLTKTQKGGLYKVDGEFVDANGKPVKPAGRSAAAEPNPDDIPDDFPGFAALGKHGWKTYADLEGKTREDYIAVKGIGETTADEIMAAVQKRAAQGA